MQFFYLPIIEKVGNLFGWMEDELYLCTQHKQTNCSMAMKHKLFFTLTVAACCMAAQAQGPRRPRFQREAFQTETPMAHDPVMAKEDRWPTTP